MSCVVMIRLIHIEAGVDVPFYIEKTNVFKCDNCGYEARFKLGNNREVRKHGWAISKDYRKCYCPGCKDLFTSVGCQGRPQWYREKYR